MFESGGQNRRCRLDRSHHRSEKVPYHEPSRQTGEVRRAHASACATTRRAVLGSEPRARAYRAGRSAPIRRLGEAPWSARIVIVAHPLLPGEKSCQRPESPRQIFTELTSSEKLLESLESARVKSSSARLRNQKAQDPRRTRGSPSAACLAVERAGCRRASRRRGSSLLAHLLPFPS